LTLELPDGTKSFIPAAWTDLKLGKAQDLHSTDKQSTGRLLGSIFHLRHARKIVDALLRKLDSSEQVHRTFLKEENKRATATRPLDRPTENTSESGHMGRLGPTGTKNGHRSTGQTDQQVGLFGRPQ
jgi:hypothetical protein